MGLFGNIAKIAAVPLTGGASLLPWDKMMNNGYSPKPYQPTPPLTAAGVKLPQGDLANALGGIGTAATAGIGANYNRLKARNASESNVRGTGPNSYAAERFPVQQGLDTGALEASLAGGLGNTAYSDAKAQREYNQNLSLTDQIAAANKPSLLDQIFSGIGMAGKAGGQFAALKNPKMQKTGNYPMTANNYDVAYDPYSGYG